VKSDAVTRYSFAIFIFLYNLPGLTPCGSQPAGYEIVLSSNLMGQRRTGFASVTLGTGRAYYSSDPVMAIENLMAVCGADLS
jgi:hypothetical protein